MKILVVGGGGREHAFCWALSKSPNVRRIYCAPGNAGTAQVAQNVDIKNTDFAGLIDFAKSECIDLTICPMDEPLVKGIVDDFAEAGLLIFGPSKAAAQIEGSKVYARDFMLRYNIPTMARETFDNYQDAMAYASAQTRFPLWIKTDGLAAGKGAIGCYNMEEVESALREILVDRRFGDSGNKVVIEEHLDGVECSVLTFCDGVTVVPMPGAMDHKAIYDGNKGPNTGGMGIITPNPHYDEKMAKQCMEEIFLPTMAGLRQDGREFVGVLFFGLMLTADGPKVLEYNCRPGDPETQALLPLLDTDLLEIITACLDKNLDNLEIKWKDSAICCVMAASGGYPGDYETGRPISGLKDFGEDILVFHSGTKCVGEDIVTSGGRVLCISAMDADLAQAKAKAYAALSNIRFDDMHFRNDIGG